MSARLLTTMDVRKVGRKEWQFLAPMIVLVVLDEVEYLIRVPDGFITDFASVPRIPLAFWLFGGIGEYAAAVHDYLYWTREFPRAICDRIFQEVLMHVDDTGKARATAMHAGVRIGGHVYYYRDAA